MRTVNFWWIKVINSQDKNMQINRVRRDNTRNLMLPPLNEIQNLGDVDEIMVSGKETMIVSRFNILNKNFIKWVN